MSENTRSSELRQQITDICFENGGVNKPMSDNTQELREEWTELDDMSTFAHSIKRLLGLSEKKAMALETLIVEQFSHGTRDGWCCACDADIAFATKYIQDEPEFKELIKSQTNQAVLEALDLYEKDMQGYNFTPEDYEGGEDTNALVADALKNSKEYVRKQITQEVQTDE